MRGFNVGVTMSLGDIELAIDYLNERKLVQRDILNTDESDQECVLITDDLEVTNNIVRDGIEIEIEEFEDVGDGFEDEGDELEYEEFEFDDEEIWGDEEVWEDEEVQSEDGEVELDDNEDYFEIEETVLDNTEIGLEDSENWEGDCNTKFHDAQLNRGLNIGKKDNQLSIENRVNSEMEREVNQSNKVIDINRSTTRRDENNRDNVINALDNEEEMLIRRLKEIELKKIKLDTENKKMGVVAGQGSNKIDTLTKIRDVKEKERNGGLSVEDYSAMKVDVLYREVRTFMRMMGVDKAIIPKKELEKQFGANNIRRLILKSYLILMGKGVTIGK